jgi:hypothetical protein
VFLHDVDEDDIVKQVNPHRYLREAALQDRAVPIVAHRVALPASLQPVDMLSALPPDKATLYSGPSRLVLDTPRPVNRSPRVFGSHREYVALIRRLLSVGMASLTTHPQVVNGVFCVPKDTKEDRLIIDAVFANAHFVEPIKVQLPDPSHLARLMLDPIHKGPVYVAKSDLSNFYHHIALPEWIRPYFCLVGVPASDLGMAGTGLVYPMLHTTPMGWSHSVEVAQSIHEHTLYSAGALCRADNILHSSLELTGTKHGVYIDDFFCMSLSQSDADAALDAAVSAYEHRGFLVKASKVQHASADGVTVLGLVLDGRQHTVSVAVEDRVDLLRSTLHLLAQPSVTGLDMAALVGRFTWCMLVRRPALTVFHHVYRFVHVAKATRFRVWPTVVRELLLACALLPLLEMCWSVPLAPRLVCTDASDMAGAVVSRPTPHRLSLPVSASEVPSLMSCQPWSTIVQHRWRYSEHINALELRAILLGVLWCTTLGVTKSRLALFTDSTVCLGVILKGRTSARTLRLVHSTLAALCLAAGVTLYPCHVPSHLNPADAPSRFKREPEPPDPSSQ